MRALRFLNLAILSVLVGSSALVHAQDEKQQQDKPRQEEAKPQPKQEEARPSRQEEAKPAQQDRQLERQDQKRGQEQSGDHARPQEQRQERPEMQGDHSRQGQEHPEMQGAHGKAGGKGGRIPDDKFRAQFGREHHFNAKTVIVQGQPRFQYGGYTFELINAWPAEWVYTDDYYIDYIDGDYYLIDLFHPEMRLAVFVVM